MARFLKYEKRICEGCGLFCKVLEMGYRNRKKQDVGGRQQMAKICGACNIYEALDEAKIISMMEVVAPVATYLDI